MDLVLPNPLTGRFNPLNGSVTGRIDTFFSDAIRSRYFKGEPINATIGVRVRH